MNSLSRKQLNVLLVAEHSEIDIPGIITRCNEADIAICGGIFPMIIHNDGRLESGAIHKVVPTNLKPVLIKDISQPFKDELPDQDASVNSSLVLVDGLSPNVSSFLDTLYEKYWNEISYVGGGAGSITLEPKPCIFTNEGFFQNAGLMIRSALNTQLGVKHGWEKIAGPFLANKTAGNKIIELNWQPAMEVYKQIVEDHTGLKFEQGDFLEIARGFPFGIYRDGQDALVRDPIAALPDGTLICAGKVGENTALNILMGNHDKLIDNAREAAKQARVENAKEVLISDNVSRSLYLQDNFQKEIQSIKSSLGYTHNSAMLEGILSLGEVSSSVNGYLEFHNKTIVVSSFY